MRRQFSWPTRTWNKDEIANLLAMFYPKSKKYNEYMETVDVLHKNDMMQADLFSAINKMRTKDPETEFLTIDYTIFRGPMQQRVSGPCSGLGQLLVKSRTRMQFIDLDEVQYIAPRPYGDVRVVDEILALAIHLNLIAYDESNDTLFLTEQGESAVINEGSLNPEWWLSTLLSNPIVRYVLSLIKNGFENNDDRYTSLIEIEEQFGFYDGIYYNPETYIGRLYSEDVFDYTYIESDLAEMDTVATNYLPNVLQALEKEGFIFPSRLERRDGRIQQAFTHTLLCYTITNSGIEALNNNDKLSVSLWIVANGYDRQEDIERRIMLLSFLTHTVTEKIGGLNLENICRFFQKDLYKENSVDKLTVLLDIIGMSRLGIPICYRYPKENEWKELSLETLNELQTKDIDVFMFYSPAKMTGDSYLNPVNAVGLSDIKKKFCELLHTQYQYLSLVDYWQYLLHETKFHRTYEYMRFNKLIADLIYHNGSDVFYVLCPQDIFAMDDGIIEIETNPFPIMPLLAHFDLQTNDLYILDTSALFYNKEKTNRTYVIFDEPEISIHNTIESYLMSKINKNEANTREIRKADSNKFEYMAAIVENMVHFVVSGVELKMSFSDVHEIKYIVLYHGDTSDVKDIEETYQNMVYNVPVLKNSNFYYREWFDFIRETTE